MTGAWLLQFGYGLLAALVGAVGGWLLRGRLPPPETASPPTESKQLAEGALQSLHSAAETVRSCVEQHIDCIQAIRAELTETSATEPMVINNAAARLIEANGLVRHQFTDIERMLDEKTDEISDALASPDGLMFTFASLDRQKHVYRQVLASLEVLAAELASEVKGHGKRLQTISDGLEGDPGRNGAAVIGAVTQILDATDEMQQRVEATEKQICDQAQSIHMQAILTHTDLLTSLPNRRAFEEELQSASVELCDRGVLCSAMLLDIDHFKEVNAQYGHQGGDLILRQAAAMIKELVRGRHLVARFGGDTLAILLHHTTLHDAIPVAERLRNAMERAEFSHGNRPLRVTASLGVSQLQREEPTEELLWRCDAALSAAQRAGGNTCYRHDGHECCSISSAFQSTQGASAKSSPALASWWDESAPDESNEGAATSCGPRHPRPVFSGRSLFAANLNRRLAEWRRGGAAIAVVVLQVDRMEDLVGRFGSHAQGFLRQVLGRLLEASTRDMDERCEFEDGLFAMLLPDTDEASAVAVGERLRRQVRQCKVRMGEELWDLTASIGVAHCATASRAMDLMLRAEAAMKHASQGGGDAVSTGEPVVEGTSSEKAAEH